MNDSAANQPRDQDSKLPDLSRKDDGPSPTAHNRTLENANDLALKARDLVLSHFPEAIAAFLGGSSAAGTATPSSDLDIAVLRPAGCETFRDTTRTDDGRIVEWFVHTTETVDRFLNDPDRRAVMAHIYGHGLVLANRDGAADAVATKARAILQSGPQPRDTDGLEALRYSLTDAYDDLTDAHDPHEQLAIATVVVETAADLLCELRGTWTGRGKWLPRRLREADAASEVADVDVDADHGIAGDAAARAITDASLHTYINAASEVVDVDASRSVVTTSTKPQVGRDLMDGWLVLARTGDVSALLSTVGTLLDEAGGPLREGFRRTAPPTA